MVTSLPQRMAKLARRAGRIGLDLVLPPRCFACGATVAEVAALCGPCWSDLGFITAPLCQRCGRPFEFLVDDHSICGGCLAEPPVYARARAVLAYDEASRPLLLRFKHGDELHAAPLFAAWLQQAGAALLQECDLIIPVPLHRGRLFARRYNQSAVLANALSRGCGVASHHDLLLRHRATPSQGRLSRAGRLRNVAGAFRVDRAAAAGFRNKRVLLIDDVMTSGATANTCSRALLRAGIAAVDVLTIARVL